MTHLCNRWHKRGLLFYPCLCHFIGAAKDTTHTFVASSNRTYYAYAAVVWDSTGTRTLLPYGSLDTLELKQSGDGMIGACISRDGKTAIGYLSLYNSANSYSCKWTQGSDGAWTLQRLAVPEGGRNGKVVDLSGDGSIIAGTYPSEQLTGTPYGEQLYKNIGNIYCTFDDCEKGYTSYKHALAIAQKHRNDI